MSACEREFHIACIRSKSSSLKLQDADHERDADQLNPHVRRECVSRAGASSFAALGKEVKCHPFITKTKRDHLSTFNASSCSMAIVVKPFSRSSTVVESKNFLINFNLKKVLSPLATLIGRVGNILKTIPRFGAKSKFDMNFKILIGHSDFFSKDKTATISVYLVQRGYI
ncbi:hypothetical protein TNCV_4769681 [Trichonephila clavipes]|nr:hypothetical protein TNCV_4769681 [Trichonephila clavipes]